MSEHHERGIGDGDIIALLEERDMLRSEVARLTRERDEANARADGMERAGGHAVIALCDVCGTGTCAEGQGMCQACGDGLVIANLRAEVERLETLLHDSRVAEVSAWRGREEAVAERDQCRAENERLREAAWAVVARWDSPDWKEPTHTGELIRDLRAALEGK